MYFILCIYSIYYFIEYCRLLYYSLTQVLVALYDLVVSLDCIVCNFALIHPVWSIITSLCILIWLK